jgi:hypothetical protein
MVSVKKSDTNGPINFRRLALSSSSSSYLRSVFCGLTLYKGGVDLSDNLHINPHYNLATSLANFVLELT